MHSPGAPPPSPEEGAEQSGSDESEPVEQLSTPTSDPVPLTEQVPAGTPEAAAEPAAEPPPREPLIWRNSFFTWQHGITANTLAPGGQLSYNPTYYWSFSLSPRIYLEPRTFLFLNQSLSYELTDDDSSALNHDLLLSDTIVELRHTASWEGFTFIPAVRVSFPASKASQIAQRYFLLGAGITAVRVIPEAWALTIAVGAAYRHWFAGSNVPLALGATPADLARSSPPAVSTSGPDPDIGGLDASTTTQVGGLTSAQEIVVTTLSLNVTPLSGFNVNLLALYSGQYGSRLATACVEVISASSGYHCFEDGSATHWRHFTYLQLAIAYDFTSWLNVALGVANAAVLAPFYNADNSVRSPFNPDSQLFLSATLQLDAIFEELTGAGGEDGLTPEQRQRRRQGLARARSRPSM